MILVDTGPLVALFDPKDHEYQHCRQILQGIREPIYTTVPVLTEAFHMLSPGSMGSDRLRDFVLKRGLNVWFLTEIALSRAFELMEQYADKPMSLLLKTTTQSVIVSKLSAYQRTNRTKRAL